MVLDTKKQMAGDSKYQKTVGEGRISERHNFNINSYVHFTSVYPVHVQGATKSEREVNRNTPTSHRESLEDRTIELERTSSSM